MRQADLGLAAAMLSAFLIVGGPAAATALADPGGGGHAGDGHGHGYSGPGRSSRIGPGTPAGATINPGGPNIGATGTPGSGLPAGVSGTGTGSTSSTSPGGGTSTSGKGQGATTAPATPVKPVLQSNVPGSSGIGAQPTQQIRISRSPVTVGDGSVEVAPPPKPLLVPVIAVPLQTVAAPVRTVTISVPTSVAILGDSHSSVEKRALSMTTPGVVPVWLVAEPGDLWNGFFGLAGLVLMPLAGLWLGYRQARAEQAAGQIIGG